MGAGASLNIITRRGREGGEGERARPSGVRAGAPIHWVGVDEDGKIPARAQGTQKREPLNWALEVCLQSGEALIISFSLTYASLWCLTMNLTAERS